MFESVLYGSCITVTPIDQSAIITLAVLEGAGRIQDFVLGGAYRDGNGGVPLQTCQGVWESAVSTAPKP